MAAFSLCNKCQELWLERFLVNGVCPSCLAGTLEPYDIDRDERRAIYPGQENSLCSLSCRITLQQDQKLKEISRRSGRSVAAIIRALIDQLEPLPSQALNLTNYERR